MQNNFKQFFKYLFLSFLLALPYLFASYNLYPSNLIFGAFEAAAEVAIITMLVIIYSNKKYNPKNDYLAKFSYLFVAFFSLLCADIIYMFTIAYPEKETLLTFKISILMYNIFFGSLLFYIYKYLISKIKSLTFYLSTTLFSIIFGYFSFTFVLFPYLSKETDNDNIVLGLCLLFSVIEVLIVGISMSFLLFTRSSKIFSFFSGLLLMGFGDLMIRYEQVFSTNGPKTFFEYAWLLGISLISLNFIKYKEFITNIERTSYNLVSLRSLIPISGIFSFFILFAVGIKFEIINNNIYTFSIIIILFYFVYTALNFISLKLANYIINSAKINFDFVLILTPI